MAAGVLRQSRRGKSQAQSEAILSRQGPQTSRLRRSVEMTVARCSRGITSSEIHSVHFTDSLAVCVPFMEDMGSFLHAT
jgi:hypothetical protein